MDRYILKEITLAWLAVVGVLLLVALANQLVRYLGDAVAGDLPTQFIATLLGLSVIRHSIIILPLSFYLAVVLVLGRMYADSEMPALFACGVGPRGILRPVMLGAVALAVGLGILSLYGIPHAKQAEAEVREQAQRVAETQLISAGRFHQAEDKGLVFYVEGLSNDGKRMQNVFLQDHRGPSKTVVSARQGHWGWDADSGARMLVLEDGYRYEGIPGRGDYRITHFGRYSVIVREPSGGADADGGGARSTATLWGARGGRAHAELQWRLSGPVMVLALALLAVPLARTNPRQGRYARVAIAVMVYIVYVNLINLARSWLEDGAIPPWVGLWWVHGLLIGVALALLAGQLRWPRISARLWGH